MSDQFLRALVVFKDLNVFKDLKDIKMGCNAEKALKKLFSDAKIRKLIGKEQKNAEKFGQLKKEH